ncbi:phage tail sheath C-terminal domain-containing protein [Agriterribacter sp.]|uniref:phage tail sheath C-terminal domain-containing protein n=1 Tax=Agriterribacter sp. TaxID=2821509 RepID=UPI002BB5F833|nr:phage tail sheath C-terminal domain-containing protein [Agriterribacter sp.]HRO45260.1 phage tail sheath C-terminal domain-containing protein [Agriterribacter sp.]HRQ16863.1 phage tail sheath C-terminal domain-containing protein [Agriterribacter sp.]
MPEYKTPGVYIEEIPKLPPSIASVETAIPAFIGYTQKAQLKEPADLINIPKRISSMLEYEQFFGGPLPETTITVTIDVTQPGRIDAQGKVITPAPYLMYYSLQLFFINGGGPCYIVSVGDYSGGGVIDQATLQGGLDEVEKINEVTLLLFPDGLNMTGAGNYYALYKEAMDQCAELKDRFAVLDVWVDPDATVDNIQVLRDFDFGTIDTMKYAAVYYPRIYTRLDYQYDDEDAVTIVGVGDGSLNGTLAELKSKNNAYYFMAKSAIADIEMLMPASSAVVGRYAEVDNTRGVWKAPANVGIDFAIRPEILVTHKQQEGLNVDTLAGKSINVIRSFAGRGPAIIWGARTLAGNDNEWRYISVRRFFNMVEESTKNATERFVFEPNDRNTWIRVKSMIENYLTQQWKAGALMGTTTREAYFVKVGLGETMTELDIWEGRMIVEIGLAVVRPAEFIILRFMHKMLQE